MSETAPKPEPRESKVVQEEYGKLCAVAGDKQYRVQALRAELDDINQRLYTLNSEYVASKAKEAAAPATPHLEAVKDAPAEVSPSPVEP